MSIDNTAVEAAARALYDWSAEGGDPDCSVPWGEQDPSFKDELRKLVRIPLGAAAGAMHAHALRDAAGDMHNEASQRSTERAGAMRDVAHWLRARADKEEDAS